MAPHPVPRRAGDRGGPQWVPLSPAAPGEPGPDPEPTGQGLYISLPPEQLTLAGFAQPAPLDWAEVREQASGGRLLEFLLTTPLTSLAPAVAATVLNDVRGADPMEAAGHIVARVRSQVSYMPGTTGVRTNAQEAWDQG